MCPSEGGEAGGGGSAPGERSIGGDQAGNRSITGSRGLALGKGVGGGGDGTNKMGTDEANGGGDATVPSSPTPSIGTRIREGEPSLCAMIDLVTTMGLTH